MFNTVLLVCIGNICRSPVAEGLFKKYSDQYDLKLSISSAGVHAVIDEPAQRYSLEVSKEHGIDISAHRARQLTLSMVNDHEIILVMDEKIRQIAVTQFPLARGKINKIGNFNHCEIIDPYRQPKVAFDKMYIDIEKCVQNWVEKVWKINLPANFNMV